MRFEDGFPADEPEVVLFTLAQEFQSTQLSTVQVRRQARRTARSSALRGASRASGSDRR